MVEGAADLPVPVSVNSFSPGSPVHSSNGMPYTHSVSSPSPVAAKFTDAAICSLSEKKEYSTPRATAWGSSLSPSPGPPWIRFWNQLLKPSDKHRHAVEAAREGGVADLILQGRGEEELDVEGGGRERGRTSTVSCTKLLNFFSFTLLSAAVSLKELMAATLTLLKLPILPNKPLLPRPSTSKLKPRQASICILPRILSFDFVMVMMGVVLLAQDALAVGGEFGILEGRSFALIHPIVMGSFFLYTLWAGYLGWQWRRVRTIQNDINELKKQVKPNPVTPDGKPVEEAAPSPVELQIQQLTEERKELIKGSYKDRHFNAGSILLGFGVLESVGGGVNTWFRTGKLFPGPHLFAGAAITALWALAAALVPSMQKGNETARNLHIALNAVNVLLFVWQIPTGIDIVFKVFEFTTWP
ncbi:hypothetical protein D0Y65_052607 [Glycine soja]|nr:hypothetical protein D0Y65_052607 [Glycine soja]RZB49773.1 hypothetical protein D0Y65_052607 [Glycine soja]